jgi:Resolvase, N terminal domain
MKYGYARISTMDQNPALQLAALKKAGCQKIFKDERTGADTKRPALLRCLKTLQDGDALMVILALVFYEFLSPLDSLWLTQNTCRVINR